MNKNNILTVAIIVIFIVGVGALIYSGKNNGNNKTETVAVDEHGHSLPANAAVSSIADMVDKPAPDFSLSDRDGKVYSLSELRGKNIILFFNEGLMCYPACWSQIASFPKDERFSNTGTVVLSIVVDSADDWQSAIEKMPELAAATVVFDKGATVSKQFDMLKSASSMHYGSLPGHTYVLIDKEGIVRHVFDDPNMAIHNDQLIAELDKVS